jgi:hypothetical protein
LTEYIYGYRLRSYDSVCSLFNLERPPAARSTVSRTVAKFNETGSVIDLRKSGGHRVTMIQQLNVFLEAEGSSLYTTNCIKQKPGSLDGDQIVQKSTGGL